VFLLCQDEAGHRSWRTPSLAVIVLMARETFLHKRGLCVLIELCIRRDLLVGDPAAIEAKLDPGGQVDTGDGFGGEVLGGEEDQVAGAAAGVVDVGHDVAVVLGGTGSGDAKTASQAVASLPNSWACTAPAARSCLSSALLNASSAKSPPGEMVGWPTAPMTAL